MRTRINRGRFKLELAKRGLDQARFAQLAGLSATTISHASTGKTINPMTFSRIATLNWSRKPTANRSGCADAPCARRRHLFFVRPETVVRWHRRDQPT
jgi:DNA-binding XRE family transcriptional regulator